MQLSIKVYGMHAGDNKLRKIYCKIAAIWLLPGDAWIRPVFLDARCTKSVPINPLDDILFLGMAVSQARRGAMQVIPYKHHECASHACTCEQASNDGTGGGDGAAGCFGHAPQCIQ